MWNTQNGMLGKVLHKARDLIPLPEPRRNLMLRICYILLVLNGLCANTVFAQEIVMLKPESELPLKTLLNAPNSGERVPTVTALAMDPTHRFLAVAGDDHNVRLLDMQGGSLVWRKSGHRDWVRGAAFSPDGKTLVTIDQNGGIRIWDVANGRAVAQVQEPIRGAQAVAVDPNGSSFAVCGFGKTVRCYDMKTGREIAKFSAPGNANRAITYSPDGNLIAVGGRNGVVRLWDTRTKKFVRDIPGDGRWVNALAFNPSGKLLAIGGDGPSILVQNLDGDAEILLLTERPGKTFALLFCDDNRLVSGESDNVVRLWNVAEGRQVADMTGHTGTVASLVYDASQGRLISGSFDTTLKFWNLPR